MSGETGATKKWTEIGRSTTTPTDNEIRKEVKIDDYYVVVGFEVNSPTAFENGIQDLAIDYGHAFFYEVKNGIVSTVFSFGPSEAGKVGWVGLGNSDTPNKYNTAAVLKDGFKNARPGTPDYAVTEEVKAFKLRLTVEQGIALGKETDVTRQRIVTGKQKYTAYMNDTCAETARDVLAAAGISTPNGSGGVKHSGVINVPIAYAVNPYMWHRNFLKEGHVEITGQLPVRNPAMLLGRRDPLFSQPP